MKTASDVSLTPNDIFRLLESDLQKIEVGLKKSAKSAFPLVNDINKYLHNSGGKRFRPIFLLLSSKLCGFEGEPAIALGVVVELIHVATLVHDDIIDNADVRRGRPSVNAKWGNQVSVLAGDWLYMTSFSLALKLRNFRVLDLLIGITRKMVEGELMQLEKHGRTNISIGEQLEISQRKTADLFSACSGLGAILGNADAEKEEKLRSYGRSIGMAFQLIDDLLDYTSNEDTLGKPVLKDLEEGKTTLPIIYLMQRAKPEEQNFVREVVRTRNFTLENKREIIQLVCSYGALNDLKNLAEQYAVQAKRTLLGFTDSIYREALLQLTEFVVTRDK
ncbi:polyprenyl synthetase family protein [Acidobacteria bacterium AH-259-O06]|nr:polyprenyl synthetase family protein [Acidobacteria bacterium AH-259-O06]